MLLETFSKNFNDLSFLKENILKVKMLIKKIVSRQKAKANYSPRFFLAFISLASLVITSRTLSSVHDAVTPSSPQIGEAGNCRFHVFANNTDKDWKRNIKINHNEFIQLGSASPYLNDLTISLRLCFYAGSIDEYIKYSLKFK